MPERPYSNKPNELYISIIGNRNWAGVLRCFNNCVFKIVGFFALKVCITKNITLCTIKPILMQMAKVINISSQTSVIPICEKKNSIHKINLFGCVVK